LQKTSKITKSNHKPNTTMPTKPYLKVSHPQCFAYLTCVHPGFL